MKSSNFPLFRTGAESNKKQGNSTIIMFCKDNSFKVCVNPGPTQSIGHWQKIVLILNLSLLHFLFRQQQTLKSYILFETLLFNTFGVIYVFVRSNSVFRQLNKILIVSHASWGTMYFEPENFISSGMIHERSYCSKMQSTWLISYKHHHSIYSLIKAIDH